MNKEMLVIPTDGMAEYRQVPTGYPALNQAVLDGGYMQEMRCFTPEGEEVVFIMDKEGKFKNLAPNLAATDLWYACGGAQLMPGDVFSGVVTVCGAKGGELAEIPQSVKAMVYIPGSEEM